jgi:epsin
MRPQRTNEEDVEYRLAIEASKAQEEEDRRKRESRHGNGTLDDDDDLAKAIKLSKEEEERRRRELEESNATSLFDLDEPAQQPQPTGYNQGYQQGSAVDFFANPIDQQPQPTGYNTAAYTGYQMQQPTGYQNGFSNGFGAQPTGFAQQPTGFDMYGQQQQQQQQQSFQPQPTGYNPYAQQQVQSPMQQEPVAQAGSNNPWATGNPQSSVLSQMKPMATGSNNPFAQQQRPQAFKAPSMPALGSLPEQKTLTTFNQQPSFGNQSSFGQSSSPFAQQPTSTQQQPQKEVSEHEARLNALLSSGDGMDTFGNTGNLRIPAQHTAPGTFVNSAGSGLNRLNAEQTGNNPFLRQQFTGMPQMSYQQQQQIPAATGPAGMGMGGFGGQQGSSNPFGARQPQQQQSGQGDLIQF